MFVKHDGEQCQANAINNSSYCFTHDPSSREDKLAAVTKGGLNRKHYLSGETVSIETPQDVRLLLAEVIKGVWTGEIPSSQPANSIAYLAKCWLDAYSAELVEEKITNLEAEITKLINNKS